MKIKGLIFNGTAFDLGRRLIILKVDFIEYITKKVEFVASIKNKKGGIIENSNHNPIIL